MKEKASDIEKNNIVIETKQETTMSSAAKAVSKSHPNLKSAPSKWSNDISEEPGKMTKQGSSYGEGNKCAPNNNIFFEERSNHLSSKGD